MTETKSEPRFINPANQPVYVRRPDGTQRIVRPFRELGVIVGRVESDCVVFGEHYAQFGGLLEPFPGGKPSTPLRAGDLDPMDPNNKGIAARAQQGKFRLTGDVVSPSGAVKREEGVEGEPPPPKPVTEDGVILDPDESDPDAEDEPDKEGAQEDGESNPPHDLELTAVEGIGAKLAANLAEIGVATAADLADMQTEEQIEQLVGVAGIRNAKHAETLVERAQTMLGWEPADEDEDEEEAD